MASAQTALEELLRQYNSMAGYTPKTADQIRAQATGEYQSYYDQLRLAAQQQQERNDLALAQQRDALQLSYDLARKESERDWATRYSQADRQMLSRGMQRSSYAAQTLANIGMRAAEAQDTIGRQQSAAEANIDAQRTQLANQLASQLAGYDANQANDILNRIRDLENQDYERQMQNTQLKSSLSSQIYNAYYQQQQLEQQQQQFEEEMEYKYYTANKKGGSGGGGGGSGLSQSLDLSKVGAQSQAQAQTQHASTVPLTGGGVSTSQPVNMASFVNNVDRALVAVNQQQNATAKANAAAMANAVGYVTSTIGSVASQLYNGIIKNRK